MPNVDTKLTIPVESGTSGLQFGPEGSTVVVDSADSRAIKYMTAAGTVRILCDLESAQTVSGVKTFSATPIVSSGTLTIKGAEAGDATFNVQADEGDDTADQWALVALAASATLEVTNAATTAKAQFAAGTITVLGAEGGNAGLQLHADEADDNADKWTVQSTASDNDLDFINNTTTVMNLSSGGALTVSGGITSQSVLKSSNATQGLGYATGAGGTVTQLTNKSTGVTINTVTGAITMNGAALADNTSVSFTVANSAVVATDVIIVNHSSAGTAGSYIVSANAVGAGSFAITVRNESGGSLSEAIVLSFAVIKGVTS